MLDSVFIVDKSILDELADSVQKKDEQTYIAAYVTDPTEEKRKAISDLSE